MGASDERLLLLLPCLDMCLLIDGCCFWVCVELVGGRGARECCPPSRVYYHMRYVVSGTGVLIWCVTWVSWCHFLKRCQR